MNEEAAILLFLFWCFIVQHKQQQQGAVLVVRWTPLAPEAIGSSETNHSVLKEVLERFFSPTTRGVVRWSLISPGVLFRENELQEPLCFSDVLALCCSGVMLFWCSVVLVLLFVVVRSRRNTEKNHNFLFSCLLAWRRTTPVVLFKKRCSFEQHHEEWFVEPHQKNRSSSGEDGSFARLFGFRFRENSLLFLKRTSGVPLFFFLGTAPGVLGAIDRVLQANKHASLCFKNTN